MIPCLAPLKNDPKLAQPCDASFKVFPQITPCSPFIHCWNYQVFQVFRATNFSAQRLSVNDVKKSTSSDIEARQVRDVRQVFHLQMPVLYRN
jgi:hypothetical protein